MCLYKVDFALKRGDDGFVGKGYKAVCKDENGSLTGTDFLGEIVFEKWLTAESPEINSDCDDTYHAGFHIFLYPSHAREYAGAYNNMAVVEVNFKEIIAFGIQETCRSTDRPCVIANQIQFVKIVEGA